jgi:hypothetical protein
MFDSFRDGLSGNVSKVAIQASHHAFKSNESAGVLPANNTESTPITKNKNLLDAFSNLEKMKKSFSMLSKSTAALALQPRSKIPFDKSHVDNAVSTLQQVDILLIIIKSLCVCFNMLFRILVKPHLIILHI